MMGADPTPMQTGHTPLHEASARGQTRMALLLLSLGGDVAQVDKVELVEAWHVGLAGAWHVGMAVVCSDKGLVWVQII